MGTVVFPDLGTHVEGPLAVGPREDETSQSVYGTIVDGNTLDAGLYLYRPFTDPTNAAFQAGVYVRVLSSPTANATNEQIGAIIENFTVLGNSKNFTRLEGLTSEARHQGSGTAATLVGATHVVEIGYPSGGGPVTEAYGSINKVSHWGSQTLTTGYGLDARANAAGTGAITTARGVHATVTCTAGATITTASSLYVPNPTVSGAGSAITTHYGLYIETQAAAGTNYAVYVAGGKSYFGGGVGMGGATNPTGQLEVQGGDVRFTKAVTGGTQMILIDAQPSADVVSIQAEKTGGAVAYPKLSFLTNGAVQMTLDTAGRLGLGTASPNAAALVDLTSTTKGLLPPRVTTAQRDAITSPPAGLVVYNTTTNKLNVYTTAWEAVTSA